MYDLERRLIVASSIPTPKAVVPPPPSTPYEVLVKWWQDPILRRDLAVMMGTLASDHPDLCTAITNVLPVTNVGVVLLLFMYLRQRSRIDI